ncbi:MAG: hypothetical protein K2I18_04285, partial [Paramuribaculum sp.]|nr:hypothetical protein [Paramuribaculum sp.]
MEFVGYMRVKLTIIYEIEFIWFKCLEDLANMERRFVTAEGNWLRLNMERRFVTAEGNWLRLNMERRFVTAEG